MTVSFSSASVASLVRFFFYSSFRASTLQITPLLHFSRPADDRANGGVKLGGVDGLLAVWNCDVLASEFWKEEASTKGRQRPSLSFLSFLLPSRSASISLSLPLSSHRVRGVERVARGLDEGGVNALEYLSDFFFVGERPPEFFL